MYKPLLVGKAETLSLLVEAAKVREKLQVAARRDNLVRGNTGCTFIDASCQSRGEPKGA